jgi:MFS family permease
VTRTTALRALFGERWFPVLLATRLASQSADGMFQAALAGAVLFNPEHHTGPREVALGFVILLLPYSLVGPFAGVFIDRWRRQRVLTLGAALRAVLVLATAGFLLRHGPSGVGFAVTALIAIGINRFYLATLTAVLPRVVATDRLVLANALTPTAGTVATIAGAGIGLGLRAAGGGADGGDALAAVGAAVGYAAAALVATRFPADLLGPEGQTPTRLGQQLASVVSGLVAGARHLWHRPVAARALALIFAQRCIFGAWSLMALLLYRNSFHNDGVLRAGLAGVGQAVAVAGVGLVTAAAVTPWVTARIGRRRWIVVVTGVAAVVQLAAGAAFEILPLLVSSLVLGFSTQATKVCVDTLVQTNVDDRFRGRVFSLYDTAYNVSFVAGAAVAAFVLPTNGKSLTALIVMTAAYLVIAAIYFAAERRSLTEQTAEQPV